MEPRDRTQERTLLKPVKRPLSLAVLMRRCLRRLADDVWETCGWAESMEDNWTIGDFNILCVATGPDEGAIYLQFWSEPHEPVPFEVSSGHWSPETRKLVGPAQKRDLVARGFRIGGEAKNFARVVSITSPQEAEAIAREVLTILYETFGYRGQWALTTRREQSQRSEIATVHRAVTAEDFAKVALEAGFDTMVEDDDGPGGGECLVRLRKGGRVSEARLDGRVPRQNLYTLVTLRRRLAAKVSDARLEAAVRTSRVLHLRRLDEQEVVADMTLVIDGGVTVAWLQTSLQLWDAAVRHIERELRRGGTRRRRPAAAGSRTIH